MTKWQREIDRGIHAFMTQGGRKMSLRIIPADCLDEMMKAAEAGDKAARTACVVIGDWGKMADAAVDDGAGPGCVTCAAELGHGDIYGFGILMPETEGTGIVVVFCERCIQRNRDDLVREFIATVCNETGATLVGLQ